MTTMQNMSCMMHSSASAAYADAATFCAYTAGMQSASHMMILGAMIMASIIIICGLIMRLPIISLSLITLLGLVLLGIIKTKPNTRP